MNWKIKLKRRTTRFAIETAIEWLIWKAWDESLILTFIEKFNVPWLYFGLTITHFFLGRKLNTSVTVNECLECNYFSTPAMIWIRCISIYLLKQWIALKVRSDWLVKLRISFAIYLRATREKMASRFASVTSEEITQINDEAVSENTKNATKFVLAVFKGNGLSF